MAATLGNANFQVGLDSTQLESGLARVKSAVETETQSIQQQLGQQESTFRQAHQGISQALEESGVSLEGFRHGLEDITQIALGFTVANTFGGAFRQIGEAMATASEASRSLGEEILKLEAITGASAEAASSTIAVWARFGISAGDAERSFTTLSRAITAFNGNGATGAGGSAGAKVLDDLGVSLKTVEGNALPLTTVLGEVFDSLNKITDPATRDYDATTLLGRSWQDTARLIKEGSAGMEELAKGMGTANSETDAQVAANEKWSLAITGMQAAFHGLTLSLGEGLAGPMTDLATNLGDMVKSWNANESSVEGFTSGVGLLFGALTGVAGLLKDIVGIPLGAFLKDVGELTNQGQPGQTLAQQGQRVTGGPRAAIPGYTPPTPAEAAARVRAEAAAQAQADADAGTARLVAPGADAAFAAAPKAGTAGNFFNFTGGIDAAKQAEDAAAAAAFAASGRPAPNFGARTAGQPGFLYSPGPAVSDVAPPLARVTTPPVAPVGEQLGVTQGFQTALEAGGGSAQEKKKQLDDYLAEEKAADEKLIKAHTETSQDMVADDTARAKNIAKQLDDELAAAKFAYSEKTKANDDQHKAAIKGISDEKFASDAYYKDATEAARNQRDLATRAAGVTHDDAILQIASDKKTQDDAFAAQKAGLDAQKKAAQDTATDTHDQAIQTVQDEVQKTRDARQQSAQQLQEENLAADQKRANSHQVALDQIHTEGQAKLDAIKKTQETEQDAAEVSLRAISDETAAFNAQHQSRLRGLQDEARAESAQHQANLDSIADEQKTVADAHTADLKALSDRGTLLDQQHTAALQAISDQAAAEAAAQHDYLAALAAGVKAETDALDAATKSQVDAIDAQLNALTAAQQAAQQTAQNTSQQGALSTAQANLGHDTQIGADPGKIIADAQAVDAAKAAIEATATQRTEAAQKAALDAEKKSITDQAAEQRKAIQDQSAAAQKAVADRAYEDNLLRQQEIRNLNDQLAAAKVTIAAQSAADTAAYNVRIAQLQAETDAENKRFQGQQAALAAATEAENAAAQAFAAAQAKKVQAVQDTLKKETDTNAAATADETKTIATSTKGENERYTAEQQSITETRKLAADKLALQQRTEDETFTAATAAANAAYKNEQERIAETYDKPITGLYAQLTTAEKTAHDTLDNRTKDANAAYKAEQDRIKQTYDGPRDDGGLALLPSIALAQENANTAFRDRTEKATAAYDAEKKKISDTYQSIDPDHLGIIPAIEKAKVDNARALAQEILDWQNWANESNKTIQSVIDKLGELHKAQSAAANQPKASTTTGGTSGGGAGGAGGGTSGGGAGGEGRGRYGDESITRAQWGSGLEQLYGVDTRDAACGPLALEGLLSVGGQNPDLGKILAEAKAKGWWSTADGMESADDFVKMAEAFGMPLQGITLGSAISDLERGVPIVLNTPKHYFLAQGYDPATGLFDMGNTGLSVFNKRYMTLAEAQAFGGGAVRDFFEPLDTSAVAGTPSRPASGDGLLWDGESLTGNPVVPAAQLGTYARPASPEASTSEVAAYIRAAATLRHINPDIALRVADSEGGLATDRRGTFATGSSWWPFQLHYGGIGTPYEYLGTSAGLGNDFTKVTGYAPGDASAWEASIDYALDHAVSGSWSQWYGAAGVGIGPWEGLPGAATGGMIDRQTVLIDATTGLPYATAAENGSELILPRSGGPSAQKLQDQAASLGWQLSPSVGITDPGWTPPPGGVKPPVTGDPILGITDPGWAPPPNGSKSKIYGDPIAGLVTKPGPPLVPAPPDDRHSGVVGTYGPHFGGSLGASWDAATSPELKQAALLSAGLPAYANGGVVDRPTLLVDAASMKPYGTAGEKAWESIVPSSGGAAAGKGGSTYHFSVTGPAMGQVSSQIRREFERSEWLHQGWR